VAHTCRSLACVRLQVAECSRASAAPLGFHHLHYVTASTYRRARLLAPSAHIAPNAMYLSRRAWMRHPPPVSEHQCAIALRSSSVQAIVCQQHTNHGHITQ
jgi:hypothetical protein